MDLQISTHKKARCCFQAGFLDWVWSYGLAWRQLATTPAPTVRPPSRIAKRRPWSMAMGWIKLNAHFHIVAWQNHFLVRWQGHHTGHVCRTEIELWTIIGEEWRVTATFFFRQDVGFGFERRVRGDGTLAHTEPGHAQHRHGRCRGSGRRYCRPPGPGRAACGTFQHRSPWSSGCRGYQRSRLPHQP